MTDKEIKTAVKYAKSWLDTGREGYEGYALEKHATQYAKYVVALAQELAALKEKYRWRKQSEEPHQTLHEGEYIEAIVRLNTYVLSQRPFVLKCWKDGYTFSNEEVGADSILYWRPLDLPDTEVAE